MISALDTAYGSMESPRHKSGWTGHWELKSGIEVFVRWISYRN